MKKPRIAIISFPGTNGDTDNLRTFWRNGFDAFVFRWNDTREKLEGVDGYFIGAGFSYEDRGRAGMVAGRDPLFQLLHEESERGKIVVGHCNGAQVLIESGIVPVGDRMRMCLARNVIREGGGWRSPGFLNEWIWMKRTCSPKRCCAADWEGSMHIPIAHGEGRFVTIDADLIAALEENDQIAFRYCSQEGELSDGPSVTLNGSTGGIAGICNPAGNVVAMMPHAERTANGDPYFHSMYRWICEKRIFISQWNVPSCSSWSVKARKSMPIEIFIETIIVNNEERTVEQAARRCSPALKLRQYRYLAPTELIPEQILQTISLFNPNKEVALMRKGTQWFRWNADRKSFELISHRLPQVTFLRRDLPDVAAPRLGEKSETGICYACDGIAESDAAKGNLMEVFGNLHASSLERMLTA